MQTLPRIKYKISGLDEEINLPLLTKGKGLPEPYQARGKTRHLPRLYFNPKLKTKHDQIKFRNTVNKRKY